MNLSPQTTRRANCRTYAPVIALLATLLSACAPVSVSIGPDVRAPRETTVHRDKDARRDKIALIDLRGLIVDAPSPTILGPGENPVDHIVTRLRRAEEDANVKAVIIRVNSPGGTVTASDTLHDEIRRFRQRSGKPIVASLGEVAASGGYYVALAADEIIAQPTTLTASIGVVIQTMNFSEGLARIGIHPRAITSGGNKDLANPFAPVRNQHFTILQEVVDQFHARFAGLVRERRPAIDAARFTDLTDGRIITGEQAAEAGLADALGGIHDAFERAKSLAGVERASLIKYTTRGRAASTVYARTDDIHHSPSSVEINLLRLDLSEAWLMSSTAWYLWSPSAH